MPIGRERAMTARLSTNLAPARLSRRLTHPELALAPVGSYVTDASSCTVQASQKHALPSGHPLITRRKKICGDSGPWFFGTGSLSRTACQICYGRR